MANSLWFYADTAFNIDTTMMYKPKPGDSYVSILKLLFNDVRSNDQLHNIQFRIIKWIIDRSLKDFGVNETNEMINESFPSVMNVLNRIIELHNGGGKMLSINYGSHRHNEMKQIVNYLIQNGSKLTEDDEVKDTIFKFYVCTRDKKSIFYLFYRGVIGQSDYDLLNYHDKEVICKLPYSVWIFIMGRLFPTEVTKNIVSFINFSL